MSVIFPYQLLHRNEIIQQINDCAASGEAFLLIVDYKAIKGYVIRQDKLDSDFVCFDFPTHKFGADQPPVVGFDWEIVPVDKRRYDECFRYVIRQIGLGNSFLTNLTQPTFVRTQLSPKDFYHTGRALYKLWLKDHFAVLSPEKFIKIEDNTISSFPMKGTIDASLPNAAQEIIDDVKEKAEHATIVDLIRNDLSCVAHDVEVKRYRYIDRIATNCNDLLQVSSEISGCLPVDYKSRLGDILFSLLPAGSICGAPKPKTLQIIEQAEGYDRNFYTGIMGWFDGANFDSAVMIRFVEAVSDGLVFKSGGGITYKSEMNKEYEELIQKIYVPLV